MMGKCFTCEKMCNKKTARYESCRYRKVMAHSDKANADYERACNMLAQSFGRKHGWDFDGWVGYFNPETYSWNRYVGGWAIFGDRVVSMDDMRTDLMEDAPEEAYGQYESEEVEYLNREPDGKAPINYYNWLHGARREPERCSEEWKKRKAEEMQRMKDEVDDSRRRLEEEMTNHDR